MKDRLSLFFINPSTSSSVKKVSGWKDSKPTKTPMSMKIKLTKDDEADSVDSSKYRGMIGSLLYLTASRPDIMFSVCLCARFQENPKTTHLEAVKRIFSNFFGPKHDLVKKNITIPRTTKTQLLRDSNKLYLDEIHPDLRGWEPFFRENFFCSLNKRNKVNTCTTYMTYYLTIRRKFNFTSMIIYRMEEVINKHDGPMPFAMLLTRLYNHILQTNPQAIVICARFTFHEYVMDPLDISRNPRKEKGKKIASPSVTSSSSSNDNEAPSFLEFYDELSNSEDLTKAQ
ncbi:hypothetical protein Tco_1538978 [Tanacetum coccineum]